ncbi:MAG TPA: type I secretion protein TolC [Halomonas sp.]|uniref:Type I secretion protein TolC n=1 Tax=Vreelandella aquamarina TaxID=77097 RepID=A0A857GP08_9GAMM|nr:TolC family protein [Halomonas meridiana]QHD48731.1 type I secretion protein TolC [Halomonas meridiana]HBM29600.1 type I secretion protein TolC [Halomonas sp.]
MNVNVTRSLILGLLLVSPPLIAQPVLEEPLAEMAPLPASSLDGPAFSPELKELLDRFRWQASEATGSSVALVALREKIQQAIEQQPGILAQRSRERESVLRIDEVRAVRRPQVNAGLEYRNDLQRTESLPDRGSRVDAVVTLSQLLLDFGASSERVRAADLSAEAAFWQSQSSIEEEVLYAVNAYLDVARLTAQRQLAEHNLEQHQRIFEDVSLRREAGAGSRADVLRAQSRLSDAESRLVTLEGELARAINVYQEAFFTTPDVLALPQGAALLSDANADRLLDRALAQNAALRSQTLTSEASDAEAQATRNARLPSLSVAVEGRQFDVNDFNESDNDVALLFNVDYTPYSGGATSSRVAQAVERQQQSQYEQQALRRELEREVRSAYTDTRTRRAELEAQTATLAAEEEALLAYRDQFAVGRSSINDLLDAQRDLFQTALELINRRVRWEQAAFQQLAVTGELLDVMEIHLERR